MTNPYEIELVTTQFTTSLELLLQQTTTRLRGAVKTGNHVGKMASPVQYLGEFQFKDAGARGSTLVPQDAQYMRRWVSPADKDLTVHVDTFDKLRSIVDPTSEISMAVQAAANRLYDDVIINGAGSVGGFFGTAQTGPDPSTLVTETYNTGSTFPKSVVVADTFGAGTATGITAKKIVEGLRMLRQYENEMEGAEVHIAVGNQEEADLRNQLEVISKEYRDTPVMENGKIGKFLGCTWHFSERLQTSGSDRLIPMWLSDGMYLGLWKELEVIISRRIDLVGHPWQAYAMVSLGSTRLQPGKVIQIACLDSQGGDITI